MLRLPLLERIGDYSKVFEATRKAFENTDIRQGSFEEKEIWYTWNSAYHKCDKRNRMNKMEEKHEKI